MESAGLPQLCAVKSERVTRPQLQIMFWYIYVRKFTKYLHGTWSLKGSSDATCTFFKLFKLKFVGSVCTQPPYNDKDPPSVFSFFYIWLNNFPLLKSSRSLMPVCVTSCRPRPSHDCLIDTSVLAQTGLVSHLRPALIELSSVCHCFNARADVDKNCSYKRLMCYIVGCYNEYSSRHLPLTSEPLKTQWIRFIWEGNAPLIYLNASTFVQIIRDPASSTEEVSVRFLMNLCKSLFLIMCLLASFTMNAANVYHLSESARKRGAGSAELTCI